MDDQMSAPTNGGRVTNADIDARVHDLEGSVSTLGTRISVVELEQTHLRELMNSGFQAVNAKLDVVLNRLSTSDDQRKTDHSVYDAYIARNQGRADIVKWFVGGSLASITGLVLALLAALGVIGS